MSDPVLDRLDLCGPYRLTVDRLDSLKTHCATRGWRHIEVRPGPDSRNTESWLHDLGHALALPAYFGANFDALYDSLCDHECLPDPGLLLIFPDLGALDEAATDTLIAVLQAAADEWREEGRRLWTLITAPGIDLDPLPRA